MEIKVRNIDPKIISELNLIAESYGFSREELIRRILKDYVDGYTLGENPLYRTIEEAQLIMKEVKILLLSLDNEMKRL